MEISQKDRDALRKSQQQLKSTFVIGSIVEHQSQDPSKYKAVSRSEQKLDVHPPEMPKVDYKSSFIDTSLPNGSLGVISEDGELDLPISPEEINTNLWLNMDRVEFHKLEWMTTKAEKAHKDKLKSTAHFDSEGRALQAKDIKPNTEAHDIQSLVNLLDSAYQPQIFYALNVVSKIATLAIMGYYDGAFDENIHHVLLKNCLLRVRRHVDSTNETICLNALKCLRALLNNTHFDEVTLDRFFPLKCEEIDECLWLRNVEMASQPFTGDMSDNQCVQIDAILALIERTDILTRLAYLLLNKKGNSCDAHADCILDILIRFARHSKDVCFIMSKKGYLKFVIDNFLPTAIMCETKTKQYFAWKAIKFIRIVVQAARDINILQPDYESVKLKIPQEIIKVVEAYYFIDCYSLSPHQDHLFRLHIETLRLMRVMSNMKDLVCDIISVITISQDTICKSFKTFATLNAGKSFDSRVSLDWQYAAHLIDLTGYVMKYERIHSTKSYIQSIWRTFARPILLQWLGGIIRDRSIPHLDVSIAITVGVNHFRNCCQDGDIKSLNTMIVSSIEDLKDDDTNAGLDFFKILLRSALRKSQIGKLEINGHLRDPKELPSYGTLNYNVTEEYTFKINSVLETDSPYVLLGLFIDQIQIDQIAERKVLKRFLDNVDLLRYIRSATNYHLQPRNYESLIQQSLTAQSEIQIMASGLLLLTQHYLFTDTEDRQESYRDDPESIELAESRCESYSQLCFNTISIVGLINPKAEHLLVLKDKLLEKVLFNPNLHTRVSRESFTKTPIKEYEEHGQVDFTCGDMNYNILNIDLLNVLKPVYLSCEQPGRFWIFQPIIEYYFEQLRDCDGNRKNNRGRWFADSIGPQTPDAAALLSCSDAEVMSYILIFNATIMRYAPAYNHIAVRPNIEEYLCLVGSIFLDDNLFFDTKLSKALETNLKLLLYDCLGGEMPFKDKSKIIKSLDLPLADFFNKLVEQFEATSYGDPVFSNFLLLFLSPKADKMFRKKLLQEKVETCLSQIRIGSDEVWAHKALFDQEESDPEIKTLMKMALPYASKLSFLESYLKYQTNDKHPLPSTKPVELNKFQSPNDTTSDKKES